MKQSRVTIRYAKALLQLSVEQNSLEDAYNDMMFIDSLCSECKDFSILLKSPIVKTDHKLRIFDEIFAPKGAEKILVEATSTTINRFTYPIE